MPTTVTAAAAMEALPPWPQTAAAPEVRFRFRGELTLSVELKPSEQPCTVRLRAGLLLHHACRRVGRTRGWPVDVTNQVVRKLDILFKITDHAVFQSSKVCSELIHDMLAAAVEIVYDYDLAASAADSIIRNTPLDPATMIVEHVGREIDGIVAAGGVVPGYDLELEIPQVCITLVYEPKALLLACKEVTAAKADDAAGVVELCGRKRRREPDDAAGVVEQICGRKRRREPDELCAICCLELDMETGEERENVRLPCSHAFHTLCIEPWFHRASTCPTCRRDIMECFSFVRSAPPTSSDISEPEMKHL
ncbi:hypothetical protein ZWY2020_027192 [Hordeum vulgare]|nr:hypothetical protein ZWY2020_027192 [Hordeum vulgare]